MRKVSSQEKEISFDGVKLSREGASLTIRLQYNGAYGMGEKFDSLNQKGHHVVNQVTEKFCFQGDKTYDPAPFFWTDTGFGLYVDTCKHRNLISEKMKSMLFSLKKRILSSLKESRKASCGSI